MVNAFIRTFTLWTYSIRNVGTTAVVRCNVVAYHSARPDSIVRQVNFLPRFFLNSKTNDRKFGPHSYPSIIWPSKYSKTIFIYLRTATVFDLSYSIRPSLKKIPIRDFGIVL